MKVLKSIYKIASLLSITALAIFFSACSEDNAQFNYTIIPIDTNCSTSITNSTISTYTTLLSGDIIVEDSNATIQIYHDVNGVKKVCMVSGSAHLIRK